MWDVVCLTCPNKELALELHKEMQLFQKKGLICKEAELLVVDDPRSNVGSGGATFNAILTVAELLSAKHEYAVININCLKAARVLVMHMGHRFELDIGGRALMTLPCVYSSSSVTSLLPNFIHTYLMITNHVTVNTPPGVWVSSTDMIASISDKFFEHIDWSAELDMLGLAVPMPASYVAGRHGMYMVTPDNLLADLWYRPSLEQLSKVAEDDKVLTLVGVVYLRPWVVESILSLYEVYPLNACTYVGVDSGIEPINLSLFMDVMRAAAKNLTQEQFVGGAPDPVCRAKAMIYQKLHRCSYRVAVDNSGRFLYPDVRNSAGSLIDCFLQFVNIPMGTLPEIERGLNCFSYLEGKCNASSFFINSYIGMEATIESSSVLSHTVIESSDVSIGRKCIINGLFVTPETFSEPLRIPDELVVNQYKIRLPSAQLATTPVSAIVLFGLNDLIMQPVESPTATYCNIPWKDYLMAKGIEECDLWSSTVPSAKRTIFTARLFPILSRTHSLQLVMWLSQVPNRTYADYPTTNQAILLETWRSAWRFSINELMNLVNYTTTMEHRQNCFARVATRLVERQLSTTVETQLIGLYNTAVIDGFASDLVAAMDDVAIRCLDEIRLARLFANIAALLGCMSAGRGGVRSGPAGNIVWRGAYAMLRNGEFEKAIRVMAQLRTNWMVSPQLIIRAARHYEGAQQNLIAKACSTAMNFVYLRPGGPVVPSDRWIVVESPCRADFAGAWTDTPPVCYELGGAVFGVALHVKGKSPIGAKVRKINKPVIIAGYLDENNQAVAHWTFETIDQLSDYDSPYSQAALIKACLVAAGVISIQSPASSTTIASSSSSGGGGGGSGVKSLADQLLSTIGAPGLEVFTWSLLPQGSGLGTSSILAGTFISALWSLRGLSFDFSSVIHAVLHFEQLLTTGGGWQDQVHGLIGGFKLAYSSAGLPVNIRWHQLNCSQKIIDEFNRRFLLVYSGQTRLAKNILQNVLRNWYSNDPLIVSTEKELARLANKASECMEAGNFEAFGNVATRSHAMKKRMAPGSETDTYVLLMNALQPITCGYTMAGAGGGGFIFFILKEKHTADEAKAILKNTPGLQECEIYDSAVATAGMTTTFID